MACLGRDKHEGIFLTVILKGCVYFGANARKILVDISRVSTVHLVSAVIVAARENRGKVEDAL